MLTGINKQKHNGPKVVFLAPPDRAGTALTPQN